MEPPGQKCRGLAIRLQLAPGGGGEEEVEEEARVGLGRESAGGARFRGCHFWGAAEGQVAVLCLSDLGPLPTTFYRGRGPVLICVIT